MTKLSLQDGIAKALHITATRTECIDGREHDAVFREVHKREPAPKSKGWLFTERGIVNMFRKLRGDEKLALLICAERLAWARIIERRRRIKASRKGARHA